MQAVKSEMNDAGGVFKISLEWRVRPDICVRNIDQLEILLDYAAHIFLNTFFLTRSIMKDSISNICYIKFVNKLKYSAKPIFI